MLRFSSKRNDSYSVAQFYFGYLSGRMIKHLYSKNAKESPEKPYLGTRVKTGVNEKGQPGKIEYNKCLTIL